MHEIVNPTQSKKHYFTNLTILMYQSNSNEIIEMTLSHVLKQSPKNVPSKLINDSCTIYWPYKTLQFNSKYFQNYLEFVSSPIQYWCIYQILMK